MLIYANVTNRRYVCNPEHRPASEQQMNMFHHALPSKNPKWVAAMFQFYKHSCTCSNHNISEIFVLQHSQELYKKNAHSKHSLLCWDMTHKNNISVAFTHKHGLNFPPRPSMTLPSSSKMSSASSRTSSFMLSSVMSEKAIPSYPLLLFSFA